MLFRSPEFGVPLSPSGSGSILTPSSDRVLPIRLRRTDETGPGSFPLFSRGPSSSSSEVSSFIEEHKGEDEVVVNSNEVRVTLREGHGEVGAGEDSS